MVTSPSMVTRSATPMALSVRDSLDTVTSLVPVMTRLPIVPKALLLSASATTVLFSMERSPLIAPMA